MYSGGKEHNSQNGHFITLGKIGFLGKTICLVA
jgi:hypothetical protein